MHWKRIASKVNILCLVVILVVLSYAFYTCNRISQTHHKNFRKRLREGWLNEYRDTIGQYEDIRGVKGYLLVGVVIHLLVSHVTVVACSLMANSTPEFVRLCRMVANGLISLVTVVAIHGMNTIWIILICVMQFFGVKFACRFSRVAATTYSWLSLFVLFYIFCSDERPYDQYDTMSKWCQSSTFCPQSVASVLKWSKNHQGLFGNWGGIYRLSFLRILSFQMDYTWFKHSELKEYDTIDSQYYCFANFWAYVHYLPLYLAGPVITFNDFTARWSSVEIPTYRRISLEKHVKWWRDYLQSLVIWALFAVIFDASTNYMYVWVIYSKTQWCNYLNSWESIAITYTLSYWHFWGKYYIILQMGKMWAMADCNHGECKASEESMIISDDLPFPIIRSCSIIRFLLDNWHLSFIHYAMRYIYVPLGGLKRLYLSGVGVLMFSSWIHDISWLWAKRGFLAQGIPFIVECICRMALRRANFAQRLHNVLYFLLLLVMSITAVTAQGWPAEIPAINIFKVDFFQDSTAIYGAAIVVVFFIAKNYLVLELEGPEDENVKDLSVPSERNLFDRVLNLDKVEMYQQSYHPLVQKRPEFQELSVCNDPIDVYAMDGVEPEEVQQAEVDQLEI